MRFKAVLLLFLLFFASFSAIALASTNVISNHLKASTLASVSGNVQPCGGEPVDDPVAPS